MKKLLSAIAIFTLFTTSIPVMAEIVVYNPKTGIYHNTSCTSATRCKTCIKIDKKQAQQNGARACKKCGG